MASNFINRFFSFIFKILSFIFITAMVLSLISMYISPSTIWPLSFLGISFPILFIINAVIFLLYLISMKKFVIYPLFSLILSLLVFGRFVQIGDNEIRVDKNTGLGVLSYNVHVFGRWDEEQEKDYKSKLSDNVFEKVKMQNADIVCFQEFYSKLIPKLNNILKAKLIGYNNQASASYIKNDNEYSIITFSKFPIINSGELKAKKQSKNFCVYTDIELNNSKTIRVYNVHLKSIRISDEKDIISKIPGISSEEESNKFKEESISIFNKMKAAFIQRSHQVDLLKKHISECEYPVIIAGDFNDIPVSYSYNQLKMSRNDAFIQSGKGLGITYQGSFPAFRIDYILFDDYFKAIEYNTIDGDESDHKAIFTRLTY